MRGKSSTSVYTGKAADAGQIVLSVQLFFGEQGYKSVYFLFIESII